MELKYKNFIDDPVNYYKDDVRIAKDYCLSDFELTKDQDLTCQVIDELGAFVIPYDINEQNGVIRSILFKLQEKNFNRHYITIIFKEDGSLFSNIEEELRLSELKLTKKWKDFYVSKGFALLTRKEVLNLEYLE